MWGFLWGLGLVGLLQTTPVSPYRTPSHQRKAQTLGQAGNVFGGPGRGAATLPAPPNVKAVCKCLLFARRGVNEVMGPHGTII